MLLCISILFLALLFSFLSSIYCLSAILDILVSVTYWYLRFCINKMKKKKKKKNQERKEMDKMWMKSKAKQYTHTALTSTTTNERRWKRSTWIFNMNENGLAIDCSCTSDWAPKKKEGKRGLRWLGVKFEWCMTKMEKGW